MESDKAFRLFSGDSPLSEEILLALSPINNQPFEATEFSPPTGTPSELNLKDLFSPINSIQISETPPKRSIQKIEFDENIRQQRICLNSVSIELFLSYEEEKLTVQIPIKRDVSSSLVKCNCRRSKCLKLYCECFAHGDFCENCNCSGCLNNLQNIIHREKAVGRILKKNPKAFNTSERENRSCKCCRSGCLKKYCECFVVGVKCTKTCKCINCKNN